MKLVLPKIVKVTFCCLWVLPLMLGSAAAHRVNVFAWVENDMVYVEGKFSGGKKVKAGKICVVDPEGNELLSGMTNDEGQFSFKVPQRTDLKIVLIAGQGHQGEWIIPATELDALTAESASQDGKAKAMPSEPTTPASKTFATSGTLAPGAYIEPTELEAIVETVLDRKLKPITRMLADVRQEGPTARDIFAGIGYILGLAGIAAYVQSRRKKE